MASDPSPVYGNYHGYYTKRPSIRDPRLALLPPTFFAGKHVLDIGCNEGWVTSEIAQSWGARRVVGVDIDDTLVRAAWKRRRSLWSVQSPRLAAPQKADDESTSSPKSNRIRLESASELDPDYFPMSCEQSHGPLPIPSNLPGEHAFPHNVTFRTVDWVTEDSTSDEPVYDVVLAFSITKWIHLNHGDDGINRFFTRVHNNLKSGGVFVLEPQPWDTYGKARRMDHRLRENARHLKLRPSEFGGLLHELGFGPPQHLGSPGEGGFHRPVDLYIKK
ncbi:Bicoid-interacting protein 3-domain-containing protein [Melanogaster broomeanus]|nr:Bicoid-interacting protein 3-domain-containing protein [Melanogaster broomeanus]